MENKLKAALDEQLKAHPMLRKARRVVVALVGGTVLLVGIALLVLPGPAFVVIPAGLAILAMEFEWSRRWFRKLRSVLEQERSE